MSLLNIPDPIPSTEVAGEVLKRISALLHSETITSKTFTRSTPDGEVELAEILIGELAVNETFPHVVVSTYGVGGVPTNGSVTVPVGDNETTTLNYHAEFFMVADTVETAHVLAEELAQIVYLVTDSKQPLIPGAIISRTVDDNTVFYLFSERPAGILGGHVQPPLVSDDFAVCFVAVTRLYPSEFEMVQSGAITLEELGNFLFSLGTEAYSVNRPEYFPGATELFNTEEGTDTEPGTEPGPADSSPDDETEKN